MTALLEVHDVTKSFGAVAAVRGVSFPLYAGEAHALVGENGAGKSTIVKMLAGVHRPDTGTLRVNGEDVKIAYLPKQLNNPYSDVETGGGEVAVQEIKGVYKLVGPNDASASSGAEGEKFTAGKLGEYTVGKDGEIVLGPPTEFTAENIDTFNF